MLHNLVHPKLFSRCYEVSRLKPPLVATLVRDCGRHIIEDLSPVYVVNAEVGELVSVVIGLVRS